MLVYIDNEIVKKILNIVIKNMRNLKYATVTFLPAVTAL